MEADRFLELRPKDTGNAAGGSAAADSRRAEPVLFAPRLCRVNPCLPRPMSTVEGGAAVGVGEDLTAEVDGWVGDGDALLRHLDLLVRLSGYGEVRLVGSYPLTLLLNGDIDIHVVDGGMTRQAVLDAHRRFMEDDIYNGVLYYDWERYQNPDFPHGHYVGLKLPWRDRPWKIDLWFVREDRNRGAQEWIQAGLNDQTRSAILRLKHWRNTFQPRMSSMKIYDAVLRRGVRDIAGFTALLGAEAS